MRAETKERPILFSGGMVRAILDGRKTQTRRVVKWTALEWLASGVFTPEYVASPKNFLCPYGIPGDRLYVRETWAEVIYTTDGIESDRTIYRANQYPYEESTKWRPSIHMPRWASRILLEITDIRVERLQDISERDAEKEGYKRIPVAGWEYQGMQTAAESFLHGEWAQAIQEKHGNPWVWVIEFKRVKP